MKNKMAVLLGGILFGLGCFLGMGRQVCAEEAIPYNSAVNLQEGSGVNVSAYTAYLSMKTDTQVYIGPGTAWTALGTLRAGQPAIATGKTDNGWIQIYYIGMTAYIPGDVAGEYEIPAPTLWQAVELQGEIKINVLGDSITYGDKLSDRTLAFPNVVSAKCGAVTLNNYGWNGSSVAGPHPDRFIDRYPGMERDANLILVLGGTNDYGGYNEPGTPIGALGDRTRDTFHGGLHLMMCGLKQMYPDSEIVFMTPLRRVGYMRKNKNGYYLNQYVTAIQEEAAFWGIRVIDLFNEPELDFSSKQAVYLTDGLHPNGTGHALLGNCVYRRLFENP